MADNNFPEYSGLRAIPGVRFISYPSSRALICPLCASPKVAQLTGKISFEAKLSGHDLFDGEPQPLAAFLCSRSHVFFLREGEVFSEERGAAA